jgi:hypothetical protein
VIQAVTSTRFPYLPVRLTLGAQDKPVFETVIEPQVDTGFDGGLAVPRALIPSTVTPDGHTEWQMADGTELRAPAYLCSVYIGHLSPVRTAVIVLDGESLLGRHAIDQFRLIFDHGRTLTVEP